jgi:LPXTG-motif cell wall-anchored protein
MIKLRLVAAAAIAAAATLLFSGAAQAAAYPDNPGVTLTIDDSSLVGGRTFHFSAEAEVPCEWTITYSAGHAPGVDATQTGSGTSLTGSYKTKVVTATFKSPIKAVCTYDDNQQVVAKVVTSNEVTPAFYAIGDSASTLQAAIQNASASATITLLPQGASGDDEEGALPETGGSNVWILVLGGALVVAGGSVTYAARRRHSAR